MRKNMVALPKMAKTVVRVMRNGAMRQPVVLVLVMKLFVPPLAAYFERKEARE